MNLVAVVTGPANFETGTVFYEVRTPGVHHSVVGVGGTSPSWFRHDVGFFHHGAEWDVLYPEGWTVTIPAEYADGRPHIGERVRVS